MSTLNTECYTHRAWQINGINWIDEINDGLINLGK